MMADERKTFETVDSQMKVDVGKLMRQGLGQRFVQAGSGDRRRHRRTDAESGLTLSKLPPPLRRRRTKTGCGQRPTRLGLFNGMRVDGERIDRERR